MTVKQKLLQGIEELESFPKALDNPFKRVNFINKEKVKELVSSLKFEEPPVVPYFVADYIRETINLSLIEALTKPDMPNIVRQWLLLEESNQELFALSRSEFPPTVDEDFDKKRQYRVYNEVSKNYLCLSFYDNTLGWGTKGTPNTNLFTEYDLVKFGIIKKSITELEDSTIVHMELVK